MTISVESITQSGAQYPWPHTNIHGPSGRVVARFQYTVPAIAGQILVNNLNRINAVLQKHSGGSLPL